MALYFSNLELTPVISKLHGHILLNGHCKTPFLTFPHYYILTIISLLMFPHVFLLVLSFIDINKIPHSHNDIHKFLLCYATNPQLIYIKQRTKNNKLQHITLHPHQLTIRCIRNKEIYQLNNPPSIFHLNFSNFRNSIKIITLICSK